MDSDDEADAREFLDTTFKQACESLNFSREPQDTSSIFQKFTRQGQSILVHATTLGSVLVVTATIEPGTMIRTLRLSDEAHSATFVKTHLVAWLMQGGQYETASSPHLQGLSPELVGRISTYLDGSSSKSLKGSNKAIRRSVSSTITTGRPSGGAASSASAASALQTAVVRGRFPFTYEDIA